MRRPNTLVFYIVGDNGASAEGGMNGLLNEMSYFNGVPETVPNMLAHIDELGGPLSYSRYALNRDTLDDHRHRRLYRDASLVHRASLGVSGVRCCWGSLS